MGIGGILGGTSGAQSIVIVIAAIAFMVYRQIVPRRLSGRTLLIVPLILAFLVWQGLATFHPSSAQITDIAVSSIISLVFGILAARQLRVYADPNTGTAMAAGSLTYFLWWLGAFAVKVALAVALGETSTGGLSEMDLLIPLFFLVATRSAYLYWRATQLNLPLYSSSLGSRRQIP